jgi:hypothetical protein
VAADLCSGVVHAQGVSIWPLLSALFVVTSAYATFPAIMVDWWNYNKKNREEAKTVPTLRSEALLYFHKIASTQASKVGASGTKVDAKAVMWQKYPFLLLLLRNTRKPLASALKSGARQVSTLQGGSFWSEEVYARSTRNLRVRAACE